MKTVIIFSLLIFLSCDSENQEDQRVCGKDFYFRVISKSNGADLVLGPNSIVKEKLNDVKFCQNSGDGFYCSNDKSLIGPQPAGVSEINGIQVNSSFLLCPEYFQSPTKLTLFDTIDFVIDYEINFSRKRQGKKDYFQELKINGVLECSPCESDHVTVFKLDL